MKSILVKLLMTGLMIASPISSLEERVSGNTLDEPSKERSYVYKDVLIYTACLGGKLLNQTYATIQTGGRVVSITHPGEPDMNVGGGLGYSFTTKFVDENDNSYFPYRSGNYLDEHTYVYNGTKACPYDF